MSTREMVWQSFTNHFEEIEHLQNELCQVIAREQTIRDQIKTKKAFLEERANLPWDQIQVVLAVRDLQNHDRGGDVSSVNQKKIIKEDGTRLRVLKAIAHYEDHNRESHINERSIRIYINTHSPGFLEGHRDNIIHCALADMFKKGLIIKTGVKSQRGRQSFQYALTPQGRQVITTTTEMGGNHG